MSSSGVDFWFEMLVGRLQIGEDPLEKLSEALGNCGGKILDSAVDLIFICRWSDDEAQQWRRRHPSQEDSYFLHLPGQPSRSEHSSFGV